MLLKIYAKASILRTHVSGSTKCAVLFSTLIWASFRENFEPNISSENRLKPTLKCCKACGKMGRLTSRRKVSSRSLFKYPYLQSLKYSTAPFIFLHLVITCPCIFSLAFTSVNFECRDWLLSITEIQFFCLSFSFPMLTTTVNIVERNNFFKYEEDTSFSDCR